MTRAIARGTVTTMGKFKAVPSLGKGKFLHDANGVMTSASTINKGFNGGNKPISHTVLSPKVKNNILPQQGIFGRTIDKITGTTRTRSTSPIISPARNTSSMDSLANRSLADRKAAYRARIQSGEIYQSHGVPVMKNGAKIMSGAPSISKVSPPLTSPTVSVVQTEAAKPGLLDRARNYVTNNPVKIGAGVIGVAGVGLGAKSLLSNKQQEQYTYG